MIFTFRRLLASAGLLALLIAPAAGQILPFQLKIQQGDNFFSVANGSSVGLVSDSIGQTSTIHVTVTYRGSGTATLNSKPSLISGPSFSIGAISGVPGTLSPGDSFKFDITYLPITSAAVSAQIELLYSETLVAGAASQTVTGLIDLVFIGTVPEFVVSYALPSDANSKVLTSGSTLVFTPTSIGASSSALVSVANRGSGTGKVTGVTASGDTFQLLGIPVFPVNVPPGAQLNFSVRYTPRQIENSAGAMTIALGAQIVSVNLAGSSVGSNLTYQVQRGSQTSVVIPNDTIPFDDTAIGKLSTLAIRIVNPGAGNIVISGVTVTGAGFQLVDAPLTPFSIAPGAASILTLGFAATQPGVFHGRLRVGDDNFELSANALGSQLSFSYVTDSATVPVLSGASVIFSPLPAGKTITLPFTVRNEGTSPAPIANIGVQEPGGPFTISGLPALPTTLQPNASFNFSITFAPTVSGFVSSTLRIDAQSFTLFGSATVPGPLPQYQISGPSGVVQPLQQPAVTLTLAAPYPVDLTGVLTLNVIPEGFSGDPAVQFATGGRTVPFTIPAKTTQALFGGSTLIRLQTGSVASQMTVTPSFAIAGGADITPASPPFLQFSVASTAPVLAALQITGRAAAGFTLSIIGTATSRSLTRLDFVFTPVGSNPVPVKFSADLTALSSAWFNSSQSQAFGGQFQITIPFSLSEGSNLTPIDDLDSVSVTAINEKGASNTLTTKVRGL